MSTKTMLLNSVLAVTLAAAGAAFAADEPVTSQVQDRETVRAQHRAETANMTQAERDAYRAEKQAEMTPEQRAAMRAGAGKGNRSGKGNGTMLRDGSGAGSQSRGSGAQGANAGQGMGR